MLRKRWMWGLVIAGLTAGLAGVHLVRDGGRALAGPEPVVVDPPRVVALSGVPRETTTDVVIAKPGTQEAPVRIASFEHSA